MVIYDGKMINYIQVVDQLRPAILKADFKYLEPRNDEKSVILRKAFLVKLSVKSLARFSRPKFNGFFLFNLLLKSSVLFISVSIFLFIVFFGFFAKNRFSKTKIIEKGH